jgi:hypothetical protein
MRNFSLTFSDTTTPQFIVLLQASDEFNSFAWSHLKAQDEKYILIYSDAMHTAAAIMVEASNLINNGLVDFGV